MINMNKIRLGVVKDNIKESQSYNPEKDNISILNDGLNS